MSPTNAAALTEAELERALDGLSLVLRWRDLLPEQHVGVVELLAHMRRAAAALDIARNDGGGEWQ